MLKGFLLTLHHARKDKSRTSAPPRANELRQQQSTSEGSGESQRVALPRSQLCTIAGHFDNEDPAKALKSASETDPEQSYHLERCDKQRTENFMESEQHDLPQVSAKTAQQEGTSLRDDGQLHDVASRTLVPTAHEQHTNQLHEITYLHKLFMAQQRDALQRVLAVSAAQIDVLQMQLAAATKAHAVLENAVLAVERNVAGLHY
ncbi:hypothetical protein LTR86_000678 [Recurvomyces mirabilis]|nr:hypothetical protein LTR86_000678 [Recurvomyces mirabilis]